MSSGIEPVKLCSYVTVHVLKNDAALWNIFLDLRLRRSFATNWKTSSANRKASFASSKEVVHTYVTSVKLVLLWPRAYGEYISWCVCTFV